MMPIENRDWSSLLDAIHDTLRDVSTIPPKGTNRTQANNRRTFDTELGKAIALSFNPAMTDDELWQKINVIPFYAGVVPPRKKKMDAARAVMSDYRRLAQPGWIDTPEAVAYIADKDSYWNKLESKGPRIVKAATKLYHRQNERGTSLAELVVPKRYQNWSPDSITSIWRNMRTEVGFGRITTYHAMMELGIPVVKPDRMLVRTVVRLGLINAYGDPLSRAARNFIPLEIDSEEALKLGQNEAFVSELQPIMHQASEASGKSIREVDWLFAKMGMTSTLEEGRELVICDDKPRCYLCLAQQHCEYGQKNHPRKASEDPVFRKARKSKSRRLKPRAIKSPEVIAI